MEDQGFTVRLRLHETPLAVDAREGAKRVRIGRSGLRHVSAHGASRGFGVHGGTREDARVHVHAALGEEFGVDALPVLLTGAVDHEPLRRGLRLEVLEDGGGDGVAPKRVKVGSASRLQLGAHLQTVGLDRVERAKEAVESAEETDVGLGVRELVRGEGRGVERAKRGAVEREGALLRRGVVPSCEALGVE